MTVPDQPLYEHPNLGRSGYFVSPDLGSQEVGGDDGPVARILDYGVTGLLVTLTVPLLVVTLPVWLPCVVIGWVCVKVWGRVTR